MAPEQRTFTGELRLFEKESERKFFVFCWSVARNEKEIERL